MKSKWEFVFHTDGFKFSRIYKFVGKMTFTPKTVTTGPAKCVEFEMDIVPDKKISQSAMEQTGRLILILAGSPEETKEFAFLIAENAGEQISFFHGKLTLDTGLVSAERIAESTTEEQLIGDKTFSLMMNVEQVVPLKSFNPVVLSAFKLSNEIIPALRQYNTAKESISQIDQYLGFFKVLEQLASATSNSRKATVLLGDSEELYEVACRILTVSSSDGKRKLSLDDFRSLVKNMVRTRDHCAHLQTRNGTGFVSGDKRVKDELQPLLGLIREFAFELLKTKVDRNT